MVKSVSEQYLTQIKFKVYEVYDKNKKEWYWSNNKKFSDNNWNVEEVVLSALQDYCQMYDYYQDGDSAKKALDQILQRFPKKIRK